MTTCRQMRERMSEALDGRLEAGDLRALDAHAAGCAACRAEYEGLKRTVGLLRGLEPIPAPADLDVKVRARLDQARREPVLWLLLNRAPVRAALAAGLLVVVGVYGLQRGGGRKAAVPGEDAAVAREGMIQEAPALAEPLAVKEGGPGLAAVPEAAPPAAALDAVAGRVLAPPAPAPSAPPADAYRPAPPKPEPPPAEAAAGPSLSYGQAGERAKGAQREEKAESAAPARPSAPAAAAAPAADRKDVLWRAPAPALEPGLSVGGAGAVGPAAEVASEGEAATVPAAAPASRAARMEEEHGRDDPLADEVKLRLNKDEELIGFAARRESGVERADALHVSVTGAARADVAAAVEAALAADTLKADAGKKAVAAEKRARQAEKAAGVDDARRQARAGAGAAESSAAVALGDAPAAAPAGTGDLVISIPAAALPRVLEALKAFGAVQVLSGAMALTPAEEDPALREATADDNVTLRITIRPSPPEGPAERRK